MGDNFLPCNPTRHPTHQLPTSADPTASQVVDSPFSRLTDLMLEIVEQQKLPIPKVSGGERWKGAGRGLQSVLC